MNFKLKITFLLPVLFFIACDNNDDEQTDSTNPTDGFTHNSTFYETPNAYFEIDENDDNADNFPDHYNFFFSDGRMFDNDSNVNGSTGDYLFSLNTTNWVFFNILVTDNPSLANNTLTAGNTYIASSNDTVIIENSQIDALTPSYFDNGIEFGLGNENVGIINTPGVTGPTITINTINLDANNPENSTINIDYSMMNQNGEIITGHYEGTFGIILD